MNWIPNNWDNGTANLSEAIFFALRELSEQGIYVDNGDTLNEIDEHLADISCELEELNTTLKKLCGESDG